MKIKQAGIATLLTLLVLSAWNPSAQAYTLTTEAIQDSTATQLAPISPRTAKSADAPRSTRRTYARRVDPLTKLTTWWLTEAAKKSMPIDVALARYITPDAVWRINGHVIAKRFTDIAILLGGGQNEASTFLALPVKSSARVGNTLFFYRAGHDALGHCMIAAGMAELKGERIASLSIVLADAAQAKASGAVISDVAKPASGPASAMLAGMTDTTLGDCQAPGAAG